MTDISVALNALEAAHRAVSECFGITECTFDCDNDSGEIIFKAGKTLYCLRLTELDADFYNEEDND